MSDYIYRVTFNQYGAYIEVAIYDEHKGEAKFGFRAEVFVQQDFYTKRFIAQVTLGGIGPHSVEEAEQRIDVYQQATDIARFVNDQLGAGETLESIGASLRTTLTPGEPVSSGFHYGGKAGAR